MCLVMVVEPIEWRSLQTADLGTFDLSVLYNKTTTHYPTGSERFISNKC